MLDHVSFKEWKYLVETIPTVQLPNIQQNRSWQIVAHEWICHQLSASHARLTDQTNRINKNNIKRGLPSGKLTWQSKMDLLKMYFLLNMGIFHCYVSLRECNKTMEREQCLLKWRCSKLSNARFAMICLGPQHVTFKIIGETTLLETNSSPLKMDGWNTTFLLGFGLFSGANC